MDTTERFAALISNIAHIYYTPNRLRANKVKKRNGIENQSFNEIYNGLDSSTQIVLRELKWNEIKSKQNRRILEKKKKKKKRIRFEFERRTHQRRQASQARPSQASQSQPPNYTK